MTEYVVLTKHEDSWAQVGKDRVLAASARAAISETLKSRPASVEGEFVAVPARSWRPLKVKIETQQRLTFS
jgi:hypothetical protein